MPSCASGPETEEAASEPVAQEHDNPPPEDPPRNRNRIAVRYSD